MHLNQLHSCATFQITMYGHGGLRSTQGIPTPFIAGCTFSLCMRIGNGSRNMVFVKALTLKEQLSLPRHNFFLNDPNPILKQWANKPRNVSGFPVIRKVLQCPENSIQQCSGQFQTADGAHTTFSGLKFKSSLSLTAHT